MEGHEENRNQERGKGPMAPQGQAGRARAQAGRWGGGGPALQAWARRDSYSDTGSSAASAAAVAAEFNAAAGLGPPTLPWTLTPRHSSTCCVPAAPLGAASQPEKLRRE